jgi:hypothetical protein
MWLGGHQMLHAHGSTFLLYFTGFFEVSLLCLVVVQCLLETIIDFSRDLVHSINPKN